MQYQHPFTDKLVDFGYDLPGGGYSHILATRVSAAGRVMF